MSSAQLVSILNAEFSGGLNATIKAAFVSMLAGKLSEMTTEQLIYMNRFIDNIKIASTDIESSISSLVVKFDEQDDTEADVTQNEISESTVQTRPETFAEIEAILMAQEFKWS